MTEQTFFKADDAEAGLFRQLAEGVSTRFFPGNQAMLSFVKVEAGAKGTLHHHPEEQWGYVLSGSDKRFQGDEVWDFGPGDFWRAPGGVPHTVEAGPDGALILDVFAPPREAYRKAGSGFAQE